MSQTYFQKGFKLKAEVAPILAREYSSGVIDRIKQLGWAARAGDLTLHMAREFGFCYGVERAVEYAYETRRKFPERRIFLTGEIIHNPAVNGRMREMGFEILSESGEAEARFARVEPQDVVVLPAFGVSVAEMTHLRAKGCIMVDTTCGSVLTVWKNVHKYAREGYTVVIHGKHYHEETKATASQALAHPGGQYLCVRDRAEAEVVCAFIRGELSSAALLERFAHAVSPGFDPERDLAHFGLANQTTMLMSESLEIQDMLRAAMRERHGEHGLRERFRAFDTICSATQDRQDAVIQMLAEVPLDVMIVVGGFNSSNTQALARICSERLPTYHIDSGARISADGLRFRPVGPETREDFATEWLPEGAVRIGLTAGASTPNSVVAQVVERILAARALEPEALGPADHPAAAAR